VHELGLSEAILEAVEKRAAGRKVTRVRIRVGATHRVAEPALDQAFSEVAGGTVAEGAAVEVVVVPVEATCRSCGSKSEMDDVWGLCPVCGGADLDTAGGDELTLESIEVATA
jgi:hydrogenase nickel incorporation protein HypA/HybF